MSKVNQYDGCGIHIAKGTQAISITDNRLVPHGWPQDKVGHAIQIAAARIHFNRMGWDNYATGWTTGDVDYY